MLGGGVSVSEITYSAGTVVIAANSPATRIEVLPNNTVTHTALATITPGSMTSASAVTDGAEYIVGASQLPLTSSYEAVIWSLKGALPTQTLAGFAPYSALSCAEVTPTGELVAGGAAGPNIRTRRPIIWSSVSGARYLPTLPGYPSNTLGVVQGISADGSIAVGHLMAPSFPALPTIPVIWRLNAPGDAPLVLDPSASGKGTFAGHTSSNGRSFCGAKAFTGDLEPVVWLEGDGQQERHLLDPGKQLYAGGTNAVLDDGLTVGNWLDQGFSWNGFVWHPSFGSNNFMDATQFFASHGVPATPTITAVRDATEGGGMNHFVVEDSSGNAWYIATPVLGPNTNKNPAFTTIGTGTVGGNGFVPRLTGFGSGRPGTTTEFNLQSVNPVAGLSTTILAFSLGATAAPGLFGLRLDLSMLLGTVQVPVSRFGAPGSYGAVLSLPLPTSLVAGQKLFLQAAVLESSGALIVSNALAFTSQ